MWFPSSNQQGDDAVFLLASWHELFHAYTPDSFQPKLHNVASLIEELADVGKRFQSEPRLKHHVQLIRDELKLCLAAEDDLLSLIPRFKSRLHELVGYETAPSIVTCCSILHDSIDDYHEALNKRLDQSIQGLPRVKSTAHQNIRRLSTIAFQLGKEDNDVWDTLLSRYSSDTRFILDEIQKVANEDRLDYECVFAVVGSPSETNSISRINEFRPISSAVLPKEYLDAIDTPSERTVFVSKSFPASSTRHAVSLGLRRLSVATGISSLYRNSHTFHVHHLTLVKQGLHAIIFSQSEQAFRRLHPRKNASSDIRECVRLLTDNNVDERLLGSLELLSIASASTDSRVRLINLWSSIETLAGAHEAETTLARVASLLIPLIASRYVARIARYLAIEVNAFGRHVGRFNYGRGFAVSSDKFVDASEMLLVLASKENSDEICDLLRFCDHPLLRYHIFDAWKRFHDPTSLRTTIAMSSKRLHWHIARIYRARNLLVHQGEESPYLVPLLDNLQNYLAMIIQRMIHEMKAHPKWTVRQVTEYWIGRNHHILAELDRSPNHLTLADFMDEASEISLWPGS